MAERSNAHDSKSCYAGMYTRVQIPFSAPRKKEGLCLPFFVAWIGWQEALMRQGFTRRVETGTKRLFRRRYRALTLCCLQQNISLRGRLVPSFFRGILRNILQSLVFSFKVCYNIIKYYNDGFIENEMYFYL